MKNYVSPTLNVVTFTNCDVIRTSELFTDPTRYDIIWEED